MLLAIACSRCTRSARLTTDKCLVLCACRDVQVVVCQAQRVGIFLRAHWLVVHAFSLLCESALCETGRLAAHAACLATTQLVGAVHTVVAAMPFVLASLWATCKQQWRVHQRQERRRCRRWQRRGCSAAWIERIWCS